MYSVVEHQMTHLIVQITFPVRLFFDVSNIFVCALVVWEFLINLTAVP